MSFKKSVQLLRALTEAPLPPLMDPKVLYPEKQRDWQGNEKKGYSADPIYAKIDKMTKQEKAVYGLEKLGMGSSRVAITLRVSVNEFTAAGKKTLKDYGINPSGKIKTVVKLALNTQGILQNTSEIRAWEDTKSYMFVPIIDHSTEQKKSTVQLNGEPVPPQYSNWVQTIEVKPFSNGDFGPWYEALHEFFGVPGREMDRAFRATSGAQKGFAEKIKEWTKTYSLSGKELDNLNELLRASKIGDMAMGDLYQPANWGAIGDRLFVIDYGYDAASKLSYGAAPLGTSISIDNKGVLSIEFSGAKDIVDLAKEKLKPS